MRAATNGIVGTITSAAISIHAAHAGSDLYEIVYINNINISIHAAHAGSDSIKTEYIISSFYLYKSAK